MNENDKKILLLKEKIADKKLELGDGKFIPVTNCNLIIKEIRYNLHSLQEDALKDLLIDLYVKNKAIEELDITYTLCGYELSDWITDIKRKLSIINRVAEERKLKAMETKLNDLLSNDKKIELELSDIEKML